MRGARGLVLVALPLMIVASTVQVSVADPSTLVVDEDGMGSALHCNDPDPAYVTIQSAVADAIGGDTIKVCPGRFAETVTVDKAVALHGAFAGIDARTRDGIGETTMNAAGGAFDVEASGVVIDGFTIQGATDSAGLGSGAAFSASHSGYRFVNNIVRDNISGIYLNSDGTTRSFVQFNLFRANDEPGPRSGNGIYSDAGLSDVLIDRNRFTEHPVGGNSMAFFGGVFVPGTAQSELTISKNTLANDNSIALFHTSSSSITGNTITSRESAIFIGGGINGLTITGNNFTGSQRGVRVAPVTFGVTATSTNITAQRNRFGSNASGGITVTDGRYEGMVDGRFNWWGHSTGPSGWSIGFGVFVSQHVNFFPWSMNTSYSAFGRCSNRSTTGDDVVTGTTGGEILCGGKGDDVIKGLDGTDLLIGGPGDDLVKGGPGNDAELGMVGFDLLQGGDGFDSLQGGDDEDVCAIGADGGRTASCEN